jgi:ribosomal protein L11 methyltransferase
MLTPEAWLRIGVRAPAGPASDLLADALVAAGGAAVHDQGPVLVTYVPLFQADPRGALADVRSCLVQAGIDPDAAVDWRVEADRDWAAEWKAGLRARRVGRRFVLHPPWVDPGAGPGDLTIAVEPGMAFGTGEHATTRAALRLLEASIEPGAVVLDAGAGSGILAIAAALLGAGRVVAVDVDPLAVEATRSSVLAHGVRDRVQVSLASVDAPFLSDAGPFDVIVANILSGVLRPLLPSLRSALAAAGSLIVSGILEEEAPDFMDSARAAGLFEATRDAEEGWWSARLTADRRAGGPAPGGPPADP